MSSTDDRRQAAITIHLLKKVAAVWCKRTIAYVNSCSEVPAIINDSTTLASDRVGLRQDNGCDISTRASGKENR